MKHFKVYSLDRKLILSFFLILPILGVLHIPGRLTVVSLLFIFSFFYYSQYSGQKYVAFSFPLVIWFILTIFHWLNAMQKNVPGVDYADLLHGLKIYCCLAIFAYLGRRSFDETIKSLVYCFTIYLFLSFLVNDVSSSDLGGRMTGVIYSTGLGQTAALTGIYIAYYSLRRKISIKMTALLYVLPVTVILFTQSRNALAMMGIGLMGHAIAYSVMRGGNIRSAIAVVCTLGILSFGIFSFVLSNTALGERLADTETAEMSNMNNNRSTNTIFDKIAGDRLVYYVLGWEYFEKSPITGIGMWNYENVSQGKYPLHSEYMVHLSEGGLVGASLWLIFIVSVVRGIISSKQSSYLKIIAFFSILEILFCAIYARVFYYEFFYPVIGLAVAMRFWNHSQPNKVLNVSKSSLLYSTGDVKTVPN